MLDDKGEFFHSVKHLPPGLALIRPDRYVAAYLPAENLEGGISEMDEIIDRTWK